MRTSRYELECSYDGRVPAERLKGAPDYPPGFFANVVRGGKVTPKPAVVKARMASIFAQLALRGPVTADDLKRSGFTDAEIAEHGQSVMRDAIMANPGLDTLEWAA